jgi:Ser/Thr protein kinase RdoA (MazF antagonist)
MLQAVVSKVKNKFNKYIARRNMLKIIKIDIFNKYGINIVKFTPLTNCFMHSSFRCYAANTNIFVLRILCEASSDTVQLEGDLLEKLSFDLQLKDHVVAMMSDKNGQKIGIVQDILYCLFPYIHNEPVMYMNDEYIKSLAMIIRRIHEIGCSFYQDFTLRNLLDTQYISDNLLIFYSKKIITNDEYINMTAIINSYNILIKKYCNNTILHCDIHRGNLLLNKKNNQLVLIDFDDFCVGPPILDLAIMVQMLCFERALFDVQRAKKIIKAYFAASDNLIEYDTEDLIAFMLFNLVSASEHYLQMATLGKNEEYVLSYKRIEVILVAKEMIQEELSFLQDISE